MANMTIRHLSEDMKRRLRIQAAKHGHSIEEEVREILRAALTENNPSVNLAQSIRACFEPLGGVELDIPPREPMRDPPELG